MIALLAFLKAFGSDWIRTITSLHGIPPISWVTKPRRDLSRKGGRANQWDHSRYGLTVADLAFRFVRHHRRLS